MRTDQRVKQFNGLIVRLARGDISALDALYEGYGGLLNAMAKKYLSDKALSDDVLSEVFCKFVKGAKSFNPRILISIVSIINAFNSVSANLLKRRKEFAVLQSIGMSGRSLYKIIAYECLMLCAIVVIATGCFAPIISAILSISFPVAHYKFIFPWRDILIAAGFLLCIFVCSTIYPLYRIKRQNIIQTIKNGID